MIASPSASTSIFSTARKCGSQLAVRVFHRKVLLVIAHHRHQHLFRQRQVLGLESRPESPSATPSGAPPSRPAPRLRATARRQPCASPCPAPCESSAAARPHPQQRSLCAAPRRNLFGAPITTGASPCSTRCPRLAFPAANPGNLHRHHGGIQQRHNPPHRPHKPLRLARAPVHVLRPVKAQHFLGQISAPAPLSPSGPAASPSRPHTRPWASSPFQARKPQRRPSSQMPPRPPSARRP